MSKACQKSIYSDCDWWLIVMCLLSTDLLAVSTTLGLKNQRKPVKHSYKLISWLLCFNILHGKQQKSWNWKLTPEAVCNFPLLHYTVSFVLNFKQMHTWFESELWARPSKTQYQPSYVSISIWKSSFLSKCSWKLPESCFAGDQSDGLAPGGRYRRKSVVRSQTDTSVPERPTLRRCERSRLSVLLERAWTIPGKQG